jgi:hypothetical protein
VINSQLLLFNAAGRVRCALSIAVTTYNGGTPQSAGRLLALNVGETTNYDQGLALVAISVAAVDESGSVGYFNQSLPYNSLNSVCINEANPITHYVAGIPRVASGAIACAAPE